MFSGFMTNAWLVGTIVAIVAGIVGFFIVLRGAAFVWTSMSNVTFPLWRSIASRFSRC